MTRLSRTRRTILAVAAATALGLGAAAPALADKGGDPDPESCGLGRAAAEANRANPAAPGASEPRILTICGVQNSFDAPGQQK